MFPFSQSVNPALQLHLDSQFAFFDDLSRSMSSSFQSLCAANLKLGQNMLEESLATSRRMFAGGAASDTAGTAMPAAQPAAEHLHAYRRHLSRLAAGVQVDLARVTQQHGQETSRTARALADEVTRVAAEEAQANLRQKEEFLKNFRDPFQRESQQRGNGMQGATAGETAAADTTEASMQPEQHPGETNDPQ